MKRILFVHHVSVIGGGSYCMYNLVTNVDQKKFSPIVLLKDEGPLAVEFRKVGIQVMLMPSLLTIPYNMPMRKGTIKRYQDVMRSLDDFTEVIQKEKIEIVYLNNMLLAPYLISAKRTGCKTVMHVREHWPLNEHLIQLRWLRKIVDKNCDKLIAINHYSASIFPQLPATIVYDWIDMGNRYKEMSVNDIFGEDCSNKKLLLFTGGFQFIKGPDYVINAFSEYVKGDEYRLLILGGDNLPVLSGKRHQVKSLLEKIGFDYSEKRMLINLSQDKRIRCIPAVYELNHIIEQSHCFVSYFRMPHANLSLAENIILGNACIAADTSESREYSGNGKYAMLVPANKPKVFARSLLSFLKNVDDWKIAAREGSFVISEQFDSSNNIAKYHDVLDSLA